jgi:hypothetical protein
VPGHAQGPRDGALRLVFWRIDLGAQGPGLALRDMQAGKGLAQAKAAVIAHLAPDILVLSGLDYDYGLQALAAFRDVLAGQGHAMAHIFAFPTNAGLRTGRDMTGDGRDYTADDTQGYGMFRGEKALALLSRWPIDSAAARDFSDVLWRDLPGARLPDLPAEVLEIQRLSSTGHWDIPVMLDGGARLHLLIYQAGPPVFGNHPTRNRLRNHDETAFWGAFLDGRLPMPPPDAPFVLLGGSNLDPFDGDGMQAAMQALLAHPSLQDPRPESAGAALAATGISAAHSGPHGMDTVQWPDRPGNLRVAYILPGVGVQVLGAGVFWPAPDAPDAALLGPPDAPLFNHRPVWVDIAR